MSTSVCVRQHHAAAPALSCALLYTQFRHGIQSAMQQPDRLFVTAHRAMVWVLLRIAVIQMRQPMLVLVWALGTCWHRGVRRTSSSEPLPPGPCSRVLLCLVVYGQPV